MAQWLAGAGAAGLDGGDTVLIFPKNVVARLFDRSGWSQKQVAFTVAGKLCALGCLALIILTPLKIGSHVLRYRGGRDCAWPDWLDQGAV